MKMPAQNKRPSPPNMTRRDQTFFLLPRVRLLSEDRTRGPIRDKRVFIETCSL